MRWIVVLMALSVGLLVSCGDDVSQSPVAGASGDSETSNPGAKGNEPTPRKLSSGETFTEGAARLTFLSVVKGPFKGHPKAEYYFVCFEIQNVSDTVVLKRGRGGSLVQSGHLEDEFGNAINQKMWLPFRKAPRGVEIATPEGVSDNQELKPGQRIRHVLLFDLPPLKKAASFVVRDVTFATDNRRSVARAEFLFSTKDIASAQLPELAGTWEGSHGKERFVLTIEQEGAALRIEKIAATEDVFSEETLTGTVTPAGGVTVGAEWTGTVADPGVVSGHIGRKIRDKWSMRRARGTPILVRQYDALKAVSERSTLPAPGRSLASETRITSGLSG